MYLGNGGRPPLLDVQVLYWKDCEADRSWRLMSLLQTFKKGDGMNGYHRTPGRMQPSLPTHIHGLLKWVTKNFPLSTRPKFHLKITRNTQPHLLIKPSRNEAHSEHKHKFLVKSSELCVRQIGKQPAVGPLWLDYQFLC